MTCILLITLICLMHRRNSGQPLESIHFFLFLVTSCRFLQCCNQIKPAILHKHSKPEKICQTFSLCLPVRVQNCQKKCLTVFGALEERFFLDWKFGADKLRRGESDRYYTSRCKQSKCGGENRYEKYQRPGMGCAGSRGAFRACGQLQENTE